MNKKKCLLCNNVSDNVWWSFESIIKENTLDLLHFYSWLYRKHAELTFLCAVTPLKQTRRVCSIISEADADLLASGDVWKRSLSVVVCVIRELLGNNQTQRSEAFHCVSTQPCLAGSRGDGSPGAWQDSASSLTKDTHTHNTHKHTDEVTDSAGDGERERESR